MGVVVATRLHNYAGRCQYYRLKPSCVGWYICITLLHDTQTLTTIMCVQAFWHLLCMSRICQNKNTIMVGHWCGLAKIYTLRQMTYLNRMNVSRVIPSAMMDTIRPTFVMIPNTSLSVSEIVWAWVSWRWRSDVIVCINN